MILTKQPTISLLISDQKDLGLLKNFLQQNDYLVHVCSGQDLLAESFDGSLIITDEYSARKSSNRFHELKQKSRPLFLPILVIVQKTSTTSTWLQHGFDDVLPMPLDKEGLLARIRAFLQIRRSSEEARIESEDFVISTLDALADNICVTDADGFILLVNEAWRDFAIRNGMSRNTRWENYNYFSVCGSATGVAKPDAEAFLAGCKPVACGDLQVFSHEYSCDSPTERRWFVAKITRFIWKNRTALVISHTNITAVRQAETELYRVAHFDELTGLPNRAFFHNNLKRALVQAKQTNSVLGMLYIDLDHFKMINDRMGHGAGDQVLKEVASRLGRCVRSTDMVGRLGGDEFCVYLQDLAEPHDAGLVAEKIISALSLPLRVGKTELYITASVGVTLYPNDGEQIDALLNASDTAMYSAKEAGRGNFQYFRSSMNEEAMERANIASGLHQALERNEFFLEYQPQIDLKSGKVHGCEALIRWRHPERGLIPPGAFISIAEETGLIVPIGQWALNTACKQNKRWQDEGLPPIVVAVNLSAKQMKHGSLVETVCKALDASGLEGHYLELEVTEGIVMDDVDEVIEIMRTLKDRGIRLSMDDFGTGYSNLGYLNRFPLDTLKIDKSFVDGIEDKVGKTAGCDIAKMIIALGHNMNVRVVAEGVETEEQLAFLAETGCDLVQGFLISKPLAQENFVTTLKALNRKPSIIDVYALA